MTEHLIGVISNTHGLLRPQAVAALQGVELIIHAGDIGGPEVLARLTATAPVLAVRGNTDKGDWARELPRDRVVAVGAVHLYVLHNLYELNLDPAASGLAAVIYGHSHQPFLERQDGVLFLNPGAAGPRRFTLPVTLALLKVNEAALEVKFVKLKI